MVDLLGIISFFLLSLVVRKLVVGYLKDTNAGEWLALLALDFSKYLSRRNLDSKDFSFPRVPSFFRVP